MANCKYCKCDEWCNAKSPQAPGEAVAGAHVAERAQVLETERTAFKSQFTTYCLTVRLQANYSAF